MWPEGRGAHAGGEQWVETLRLPAPQPFLSRPRPPTHALALHFHTFPSPFPPFFFLFRHMSTGDLDNNLAAAQVALRHLRAPDEVVAGGSVAG